MNWFAVDINIALKSLLDMTFHETYMWLFLWPQEFFLIESSCKFIIFHMTSDTFSGSYHLRHFNWKVVWKTNWVNVLYKSQDTVLLYQLCCSRLVYLRCHLFSFHSVKPKSFDWRILLISLDLFDFRFTKLLHGISTGWPKTDYSYLIKPKIHNTREIFKTEIFNNQL